MRQAMAQCNVIVCSTTLNAIDLNRDAKQWTRWEIRRCHGIFSPDQSVGSGPGTSGNGHEGPARREASSHPDFLRLVG